MAEKRETIDKSAESSVPENSVKILIEGGVGEYEEKKSRFIATLRPVASEEEAVAFIAEMKKKYWDAKHNCSAFVLGDDASLTRCSDDGEPAGTAGRPMLEVLIGSGVRNAAVVVTRYFGGVLLGTGGLVRAYSAAVKEGLSASVTGYVCEGISLCFSAEYNDVGKLQYILRKNNLPADDCEYGERVLFRINVPKVKAEALKKEITEATAGRCLVSNAGSVRILCRSDG